MDQELRAILTAPRIGCTQEHIAAFEKEGILKDLEREGGI